MAPSDVRSGRHRAGRFTTMSTHQLDQAVFRSVLPEDIDWEPFPAFPPQARLAVVVGDPAQGRFLGVAGANGGGLDRRGVLGHGFERRCTLAGEPPAQVGRARRRVDLGGPFRCAAAFGHVEQVHAGQHGQRPG
jgi:hypothetical protein